MDVQKINDQTTASCCRQSGAPSWENWVSGGNKIKCNYHQHSYRIPAIVTSCSRNDGWWTMLDARVRWVLELNHSFLLHPSHCGDGRTLKGGTLIYNHLHFFFLDTQGVLPSRILAAIPPWCPGYFVNMCATTFTSAANREELLFYQFRHGSRKRAHKHKSWVPPKHLQNWFATRPNVLVVLLHPNTLGASCLFWLHQNGKHARNVFYYNSATIHLPPSLGWFVAYPISTRNSCHVAERWFILIEICFLQAKASLLQNETIL